jgi:transposase
MDLRERALARKAAGETHRQIAEALQIAPSCVSKWARRERETGSPAPAQVGGYKRRTLSGPAADWLRARIAAGPFTLQGLSDELAEEQARPDVARRRKRWKAHQMKVEPQRLVFIDETWIKTNMAPLRGWAPRGKRLRADAPFGHWKTLTFIAALRCDRIEAPFVLDGPINGQAFRLYVETQLAPTLRPGDVVVMDNLGSHKGKAARAAIRSRGAHLLFLPAYSPDLNPIEQVFAKLKHLMRKSQPRGVEAAWRTVGQILERFTPNECANSLVNAGYGSV